MINKHLNKVSAIFSEQWKLKQQQNASPTPAFAIQISKDYEHYLM